MSLSYIKHHVAALEDLLHEEPLMALCGLLCIVAAGAISAIVIDSVLHNKKRRRNQRSYERYLRPR
jgi:hypothetical protein